MTNIVPNTMGVSTLREVLRKVHGFILGPMNLVGVAKMVF